MDLINIAIIAHVDHGKTSLVDCLLKQSGTLGRGQENLVRAMDSNELEKERGITILSKTTAIHLGDLRINIVDTPGHADFGGEVERVLSMVDSVLLLVDAVDGPMPQTRFVTEKAFQQGLNPIVVVNKIDRDGARPDQVIDEVFDLFDKLGATDEQLDFPVIYTSALQGYATMDPSQRGTDMQPLFDLIRERAPRPNVEKDGPLAMQIRVMDHNNFVGAIGIGRVERGTIKPGMAVKVANAEGTRNAKVLKVFGHHGLERIEVTEAHAGDIVAIAGIDNLKISDTICDKDNPEALPALSVDEPTLELSMRANSSPFAGKSGKFMTSRQLGDRLQKELISNVALQVNVQDETFVLKGRGELHLAILLETMRREGYEMAVGPPRVVMKTVDGELHEPFEHLVIDLDAAYQGSVMEAVAEHSGVMSNMVPNNDRVRLEFEIPARGLIGLSAKIRNLSSGTAIYSHRFVEYKQALTSKIARRKEGVLISNAQGKATTYALFGLKQRGRMIIEPGMEVYEGQIVGIHIRDNDLTVNPIKPKQLTNIRASGTDDAMILPPAIKLTLEEALEFIADDELLEITPAELRIRKLKLKEHERKRDK